MLLDKLLAKSGMCLLPLFSCAVSCSMTGQSCSDGCVARVTVDTVPPVFNDSVDAIVFGANSVRLYDMADFVQGGDTLGAKCDSLLGYAVKRNLGRVSKSDLSVLRFILSDRQWYMADYPLVRHPFHPNIALEFIKGRRKAYALVSFVTGEIKISDACGNFKVFMMRGSRPMARWCLGMFPGEEYFERLVEGAEK